MINMDLSSPDFRRFVMKCDPDGWLCHECDELSSNLVICTGCAAHRQWGTTPMGYLQRRLLETPCRTGFMGQFDEEGARIGVGR